MMKRTISYTALAAALTVGLSAQAPTTSPSAQAGADSSSKPVTMTGCLRAGDGPGTFVLSNAKSGDKTTASASPSSTPGTAGTAGSTAAAPGTADSGRSAAASVKLTGSPTGVTLNDHVGHTVSVTGTAAADAGTPASASATAAAPGAASASAKTPSALNITALSMVSGSCSQ